jgi:hypothetical protein
MIYYCQFDGTIEGGIKPKKVSAQKPPTPLIDYTSSDQPDRRMPLGVRELYVDYGDGIRDTKLMIPGKEDRTGRNMNSVRKMAGMMGETK